MLHRTPLSSLIEAANVGALTSDLTFPRDVTSVNAILIPTAATAPWRDVRLPCPLTLTAAQATHKAALGREGVRDYFDALEEQ